MRPGRLRAWKRPSPSSAGTDAASSHIPGASRAGATTRGPVAQNERQHVLLADTTCLEAERLIRAQDAATRAAVLASIRARLRTKETNLPDAYTAHRAVLAGRSHDQHAAAAYCSVPHMRGDEPLPSMRSRRAMPCSRMRGDEPNQQAVVLEATPCSPDPRG